MNTVALSSFGELLGARRKGTLERDNDNNCVDFTGL